MEGGNLPEFIIREDLPAGYMLTDLWLDRHPEYQASSRHIWVNRLLISAYIRLFTTSDEIPYILLQWLLVQFMP